MARRKDRNRVTAPLERDDRYLAWRYRRLGGMLRASEPGTPAAAFAEEIEAQRDRLDASGKPMAYRLTQLERLLAELGLSAQAERFITALSASRRRYAPHVDSTHRMAAA